jgi:hypothetical protein
MDWENYCIRLWIDDSRRGYRSCELSGLYFAGGYGRLNIWRMVVLRNARYRRGFLLGRMEGRNSRGLAIRYVVSSQAFARHFLYVYFNELAQATLRRRPTQLMIGFKVAILVDVKRRTRS